MQEPSDGVGNPSAVRSSFADECFPTPHAFFSPWNRADVRARAWRRYGRHPQHQAHQLAIRIKTPPHSAARCETLLVPHQGDRLLQLDNPSTGRQELLVSGRRSAISRASETLRKTILVTSVRRHQLSLGVQIRDELRKGRRPADRVIHALNSALMHNIPVRISKYLFDPHSIYYMPEVVRHVSQLQNVAQDIVARLELVHELQQAHETGMHQAWLQDGAGHSCTLTLSSPGDEAPSTCACS